MRDRQKYIAIIIVLALFGGGYLFYKDSKKETKTEDSKIETKEDALEKTEEKQTKILEEQKASEEKSPYSEEEKSVRDATVAFEAAYKSRNTAGIFSYITEPVSLQDKDTKGKLINGKDAAGNIGGPTLFVSNAASEIPESFEIKEVKKEGSGYTVTITEKRKSVSGIISEKRRTLKIILVGQSWLIESYEQPDYGNKYSGFLAG